MGVAVDDAGRQRQPVGLHRLLGRAELAANRGDLAAGDAEVAAHRRVAGAVEDLRILDDQVEHPASSGFAAMVGAVRGNLFQLRWG